MTGFMSGDLSLQVKALRKLASDAFDPSTLPTQHGQRTFFDAQNNARLLWKLIKGNALVKKFPFQHQLVAKLYPALNAPARRDEGIIPAIFSAYWRDTDNFASLRESIAVAHIPELPLACAVPRNEDEFIAGTTDGMPEFVVDLDYTVRNNGHDMLAWYRRVARAIPEDCQIALVSKETGSYGPVIHRDAVFNFVNAPDTPNVRGAFVYSQRIRAITRTAAGGGFDPRLPVLILYDLLATGEDLHRTAGELHACCKERNPFGDRPPVFAAVVYAYAEQYRNRRFLPRGREVAIGDFNRKKYAALARGAAEADRSLSGVVYFHRGGKYMPGTGSGTAVEPPAQSRGKQPFKKFGLNTIDPTCNMENKFRVSAIFEKLAASQTN